MEHSALHTLDLTSFPPCLTCLLASLSLHRKASSRQASKGIHCGGRGRPPFFFVFFFPSHLLSSAFYALSLLSVTQIRGHIAGSYPPLLTAVRALHFYCEKISALSCLVDSRRIGLTHARRSQQLILFSFFCCCK